MQCVSQSHVILSSLSIPCPGTFFPGPFKLVRLFIAFIYGSGHEDLFENYQCLAASPVCLMAQTMALETFPLFPSHTPYSLPPPPLFFVKQTKDGLEQTMAVNFYSHALLTLGLLDHMAPGGRVVMMSSEGEGLGRLDWDNLRWACPVCNGMCDGGTYARVASHDEQLGVWGSSGIKA